MIQNWVPIVMLFNHLSSSILSVKFVTVGLPEKKCNTVIIATVNPLTPGDAFPRASCFKTFLLQYAQKVKFADSFWVKK